MRNGDLLVVAYEIANVGQGDAITLFLGSWSRADTLDIFVGPEDVPEINGAFLVIGSPDIYESQRSAKQALERASGSHTLVHLLYGVLVRITKVMAINSIIDSVGPGLLQVRG